MLPGGGLMVEWRSKEWPDLVLRQEKKYCLPSCDVTTLRRLLEGSCERLQPGSGPVTVVRSIYFDDPLLGACRENLDGISRRRKLRLRWYDSTEPTTTWFEIKSRRARLSGKQRIELRWQRPITELSYPHLLGALADALPATARQLLLHRAEPVVLVEYRREHFRPLNARGRVTLDYGLTFYAQSPWGVPSFWPLRPLEGLTILEWKLPVVREHHDDRVAEITAPLTPRVSRCSKYVHGCRQIGLLGPLAPWDVD